MSVPLLCLCDELHSQTRNGEGLCELRKVTKVFVLDPLNVIWISFSSHGLHHFKLSAVVELVFDLFWIQLLSATSCVKTLFDAEKPPDQQPAC